MLPGMEFGVGLHERDACREVVSGEAGDNAADDGDQAPDESRAGGLAVGTRFHVLFSGPKKTLPLDRPNLISEVPGDIAVHSRENVGASVEGGGITQIGHVDVDVIVAVSTPQKDTEMIGRQDRLRIRQIVVSGFCEAFGKPFGRGGFEDELVFPLLAVREPIIADSDLAFGGSFNGCRLLVWFHLCHI